MDALSIALKVLNIIGSLGLFLFGMNLMSEALQKLAGDRLRSTLSAVTSNRWRGISAGFLFTGILQSSSAVTVLIVSFVNAGMITLAESVGLIMGANIGTTVKLWFLAVLGFGGSFNISVILLPLIAVCIPLFLSAGSRNRSIAEFIMGFALLFFGLQFMREQVPAVGQDSLLMQEILALNTQSDFLSILLFVGVGILLTVVFQSSSATITLTMVLAMEQWISFELAAAMVLGENIGTTTTALFASIVANNSAKRAALIHVIFNVIGVTWAVMLFRPILYGIAYVLGIEPTGLLNFTPELIPFGLAILHTGFNVTNTIILAGFPGLLIRLSYYVIPSKGKKKEKSHLQFIETHIASVSEISLLQARKEIMQMTKMVQEMFSIIPLLLIEKDPLVYNKLIKKVGKIENKVDATKYEMSAYLAKIAQGKLSRKGTEELQAFLRSIDEIEGIGDACYKMSVIIRNKNDMKTYFVQDIRDRLQEMFDVVDNSLEIMYRNITVESYKVDLDEAYQAEKRINDLRDRLKLEQMQERKNEKYSHQAGAVYSELIAQCEKIGDFALNVTEALAITKQG